MGEAAVAQNPTLSELFLRQVRIAFPVGVLIRRGVKCKSATKGKSSGGREAEFEGEFFVVAFCSPQKPRGSVEIYGVGGSPTGWSSTALTSSQPVGRNTMRDVDIISTYGKLNKQ